MNINRSIEDLGPSTPIPFGGGERFLPTKNGGLLEFPLDKKQVPGTPAQRAQVPLDPTSFRAVLGQFGSGVTIVTTCYEGYYHGITVSSFCSLSLTPPLILVCIDHRCQSHELIEKAEKFAVNVLAEDGEWIARQFASRVTNKFADIATHQGIAGVPLLNNALATIECELRDLLPGGDHSIFVGKVVAARANEEARPLLYHKSKFHQLPS